MLTKCICTNCAGHLEFDEVNAGAKIVCPHCGFETTLFLPGTRPPDPELVALARKLGRRRNLMWLGAGLLALAGLGYALWAWALPLVQELLPPTESKIVPWIVLILFCVALPFALFWLVFPVVLCLQLRKLTRLLAAMADRSGQTMEPPEAEEETEFVEAADDDEEVRGREPAQPGE